MSDVQLETLLGNCTQCGLCRDVCIVERLGGHSITSFLCGEEEYSSWLCSSCWRCGARSAWARAQPRDHGPHALAGPYWPFFIGIVTDVPIQAAIDYRNL